MQYLLAIALFMAAILLGVLWLHWLVVRERDKIAWRKEQEWQHAIRTGKLLSKVDPK